MTPSKIPRLCVSTLPRHYKRHAECVWITRTAVHPESSEDSRHTDGADAPACHLRTVGTQTEPMEHTDGADAHACRYARSSLLTTTVPFTTHNTTAVISAWACCSCRTRHTTRTRRSLSSLCFKKHGSWSVRGQP